MNNLTRCFASSGSLSVKKIKSMAFANVGCTTSALGGFLSPSAADDRKQNRRFGSFISHHNSHSVSANGTRIQLPLVTSPLCISSIRSFSSSDTTTTTSEQENNDVDIEPQQILSPTSQTVITDSESGEQYGILLDTRKLPKLKPSVVRKRLDKCRTYEGREKSIRQSPWKLNRICQLAAGLTLEEALTQLKFCDLKNADLVAKVLKRTSNLADIRDGLQISQLEVKECFATKSLMLRRIKPMGRGR